MKLREIVIRLVDWAIWGFSFLAALWLTRHRVFDRSIFIVGLILLLIHVVVYECARMYRNIWRYLTVRMIVKGIICEAASAVLLTAVLEGMNLPAKRVIIVTFCLSTVLWCFSRLAYMGIRELAERRPALRSNEPEGKKRLLLIGGGHAAEALLEEIGKNKFSTLQPVCIVDDAPDKIGRYLNNIKIVGNTEQIKAVCRKYKIDIVIFSIYNIEESKQQKILHSCTELGVPVKMLPHYAEFVSHLGKNMYNIRDISVEDLLGREKAEIDLPHLNQFLNGKTIMVTGGGGSIGSELCRQIALYEPKLLIIVDICENGAYAIQQSLRMNGFERMAVEIVSVTDRLQMERLFDQYRPDVVYHAAAHKHVPLMEHCRLEAMQNNIFGTRCTALLADRYGVKKFVLVSTDKAVNPTNVMGATKRCCELIVKAKNYTSKTDFVAVRFGNVLGSNGSVIPLFQEQIKHGGPVTVTHPECIRYFMTIPEAVTLLLTSGSIAEGGETFVLDMGKPVKIVDLAKNMIRLSGFMPDRDIAIQFVGMRPGEKMYEELLVDREHMHKTCNEKVFVESEEQIDEDWLEQNLAELRQCIEEGDEDGAMECLKELVPTYCAAETESLCG